jgi:hypothetical protein
MGRKNRRIQETPDKNFIKFMNSINKRNHNQVDTSKYNNSKDRNLRRLAYALKQFEYERIQYEVIDESKGAVKVYHQFTGDEYIFYVYTGTLKEGKNEKIRGLQNVLEFLYT